MATLLKASAITQRIVEDLTIQCSKLKEDGLTPHLQVILVGEHPPSIIYTRNKKKFMEKMGATCDIHKLPADIPEKDFLALLKKHGEDPKNNGLFVQLPLPAHLEHIDVGQLIPPEKDVDGFHAENIYALAAGDKGENSLLPCTPKGVVTMLKEHNIELEGKNVAILGRSLIVGKPLTLLMTNYNATVTLCHSRTKNLKHICKQADIIVAAIGRAKLIDKSYLNDRKDQILVDVGINHDKNGKLCGDIDQASVEDHCAVLTPVPGGVGKMTILSLGQNLLQASKNQRENLNV